MVTETSRLVDDGVTVKNQIAAKKKAPDIEGIWRKLPNSDQVSGDPIVGPDTPGMQLSDDKRTILFQAVAQPVRDAFAGAGVLLVRYKSVSATVAVEALAAGPEGNVNSGAVVIMPTPPSGVDEVVNETPIIGGQSPEGDEQLRDRAKHALERKGNATLNAIKFAVLDVDGVKAWKWSTTASTARFPWAKCVCAIRAAMIAMCSRWWSRRGRRASWRGWRRSTRC